MAELPVGCQFRPYDEQLINHYLMRKIKGQPLSWKGITDCDLYGDKSPWEIFDENKISYVFTRLKKVSKNRVARKAGCGTWHGQDSGDNIYDPNNKNNVIGLKKTYTFKKFKKDSTILSAEKNLGNWIMHEYSLAGDLLADERCCDYVVCRIEKTVKSGSNGKKPVEQKHLVEEEEEKEESCGVLCDGVLSSSTENPINDCEGVIRGAVASDDDFLLTNQFDFGVNSTNNEREGLISGVVVSDDDVLLANQFGFGVHTTNNDMAVMMTSLEETPTLSSIGFCEYGMGDKFEVPSQSFIDHGAYGIQNQVGNLPLCDDWDSDWDSVNEKSNKAKNLFMMQDSEVSMQELVPTMPEFDSSNEDYSTFDVNDYLMDQPMQESYLCPMHCN